MAQVGAKLQLFYGPEDGDATTEIESDDTTDIQFPELAAADIKNNTYTTEDETNDYIPGFSEGGELQVTRNFTNAGETTIRDLYKVRHKWKVKINGDEGGQYVFKGYINKIAPALPVDEKLMQKFSIKVCSLPVWTAAGGS